MRVLSDLGIMLLIVGDVDGAERALTEVVRRGAGQDVVDNAMIELMHCAPYRRDRLGFERWRERCQARSDHMPPNILADFYFKSGIGRARFGQFDRAHGVPGMALTVAEQSGVHELAFRIERVRAGLRDCQQTCSAASAAVAGSECSSDAVREVSAALSRLAP